MSDETFEGVFAAAACVCALAWIGYFFLGGGSLFPL